MAPTTFFLTALMAACAVATAADGIPERRSEPQDGFQKSTWATGNCGIHIHQTTGDNADLNIYSAHVTLKDANKEIFFNDQFDMYGTSFKVGEDIFDEPIVFTRHEEGDGDPLPGHVQGFRIRWHDDEFDTNTGGRCTVGEESDPNNPVEKGVWTRDFDCGFAC